jgi:hypothetical protein
LTKSRKRDKENVQRGWLENMPQSTSLAIASRKCLRAELTTTAARRRLLMTLRYQSNILALAHISSSISSEFGSIKSAVAPAEPVALFTPQIL